MCCGFFPSFKSAGRGGKVNSADISQPLLSVECYKRVVLCMPAARWMCTYVSVVGDAT